MRAQPFEQLLASVIRLSPINRVLRQVEILVCRERKQEKEDQHLCQSGRACGTPTSHKAQGLP